ncbi:uncharacterized protein C9orf43 homolog [Spea bombifrons]|uniref:uncharacterized protein C9orf43 homolog n=1 Tax=Spea bombifrons TaxID=233779 RepID=UPI00234BABE9|nr:uncharacterized protein C9orf43 homolog [Spea bombifrons]
MAEAKRLDETLCPEPVCQHPQCWVTVRRLEQGCPRYRPSGAAARSLSAEAEGLPVLTVTTLPEPIPPGTGQDSPPSLSGHRLLSSAYSLHNSLADSSSVKTPISAVSLHKELMTSFPTYSLPGRKTPKVGVVSVGATLPPEGKQASLIWVPNSQHKQHKAEPKKSHARERALPTGIKEITLEMFASGGAKSGVLRDGETRSKKDKKLLTSGPPFKPTLCGTRILFRGHIKEGLSASATKENAEGPARRTREVCGRSLRAERLQPSHPGFPLLENRRVILHDIKERRQPCVSSSCAAPVYKLDTRLGSLDDLELDLESIRNQYYLWKKYVYLASPGGRFKISDSQPKREAKSPRAKPRTLTLFGDIGLFLCDRDSALGGRRGPGGSGSRDSEQSDDTDNRDSASLASFSPSSLAYPESQAESQAEQRDSPNPTTDGETAEAPQELEKDPVSTEELQPKDPPESTGSTSRDPDWTSPGGKPTAPPPSPTHAAGDNRS